MVWVARRVAGWWNGRAARGRVDRRAHDQVLREKAALPSRRRLVGARRLDLLRVRLHVVADEELGRRRQLDPRPRPLLPGSRRRVSHPASERAAVDGAGRWPKGAWVHTRTRRATLRGRALEAEEVVVRWSSRTRATSRPGRRVAWRFRASRPVQWSNSTSNGRIRPDGVVEFDLLGGRVDLSGWSTRPLGVAESTCWSGRIAALWRGEWDFFYDDSTPPKWPLGPTPGATRRACRVDSPGRVGARGVDSARGGGRLGAASRPRLRATRQRGRVESGERVDPACAHSTERVDPGAVESAVENLRLGAQSVGFDQSDWSNPT